MGDCVEGSVTKTSLLTAVLLSPSSELADGLCGSAGSHTSLLLHHRHGAHDGADVPPLWGPSSKTSASPLTLHYCQ